MRTSRRYWIVVVAVSAAWLLVAAAVVPWLIREAYAGESLPFFNGLLSGRSEHPLETYLDAWAGIAWRLTAMLASGLALLGVLVAFRHRISTALRPLAATLPTPSVTFVLLVAIWLGLLGGLAEASGIVFRYVLQHMPTGETYWGEVFWMAPLAACTTLLVLAGLLVLASRVRPSAQVLLGLAPGLFATLAVFSFVRSLRLGLATWAIACLALGVAVQLTRSLRKHPRAHGTLIRRGTGALTAGTILWALALPAARGMAERRALAALPPAESGSPNVLLVIWDTVRAMSLSAYGYERSTTPVLDGLAARGVTFDRAIATAPWTLPSHASVFTGRYHHELSVGWNTPLDDAYPTLAEFLSERGYATAGLVANYFYAGSGFGLDRGFTWYDDRVIVTPSAVASSWTLSRTLMEWVNELLDVRSPLLEKTAAEVNEAFLDWLDRDRGRPFFAFLNVFDAHEPYVAPAPFNVRFTERPPHGSMPWYARHTREEIREYRDAYDSCIAYIDHQLGLLLEELEARGVLDNTLVILTSDHGEEFGEHGADLMRHGRSLYLPALQVPLVVSFPRRFAQGVRVDEPVSIRDIPQTVADFLGWSDESPFPGSSLLRHLVEPGTLPVETSAPVLAQVDRRADAESWPQWPAANGPMHALVEGSLHYITDARGVEQLFDMESDPWEQDDLITSAEGAALAERYRAILAERLAVSGVNLSGPGGYMDQATVARAHDLDPVLEPRKRTGGP